MMNRFPLLTCRVPIPLKCTHVLSYALLLKLNEQTQNTVKCFLQETSRAHE